MINDFLNVIHTMPKSRVMSAGTVGTNRRIRVNGPEGGGDALQGLPAITNMPSTLVPFARTRADGNDRNVVFCVNQLGGVGRKRTQFGAGNKAGVGNTGGCNDLVSFPWWFNNAAVLTAIGALTSYFASLGLNFVLVGESETLQSDIGPTFPVTPAQHIFHYAPGFTEYDLLSAELKGYVNLINSIGFNFPLNIAGPGPSSTMIHICGAVTDGGKATLEQAGYGFDQHFGTSGGGTLRPGLSIVAYGTSCVDPTNGAQAQTYGGSLWNKTTSVEVYNNVDMWYVDNSYFGTSCMVQRWLYERQH